MNELKRMNWHEWIERSELPKVHRTPPSFKTYLLTMWLTWNGAPATVSCTFYRPHFARVGWGTHFFYSRFWTELSLQSRAYFVDRFPRSRRETSETDTLHLETRGRLKAHRGHTRYMRHLLFGYSAYSMSLSGLTGAALSALAWVAYSTYLRPRAFLRFRKTRFEFLCFHENWQWKFCVSTKNPMQKFVFPPKCEMGFCVPVNVCKCT